MNKWTLVNPLVSNIDTENMSIVTNNGMQAAMVLYERLSKDFTKEVDGFQFTVKQSEIPKHMEHTGGYGDDYDGVNLVGGGTSKDYHHFRIKESRTGNRVKFEIEKDTVDNKQIKKFIKALNEYDKEQEPVSFNAYSPDNQEFDNYSLDFSLNDSSIEKLDDEDDAKYSPQFDQFGGGKKKKKSSDYSDDSDDSSSSSDSYKYMRRKSKHLRKYVNDFTPTRIWTYHPYLYRVSKLIVPSFNVSTVSPSPYFYISMF